MKNKTEEADPTNPMNKKRGPLHGIPEDNPDLQRAYFALGCIYASLKNELNSLAATASGAITARDAARWLAGNLRAESQESGKLLDDSEPVPALRRNSTQGHALSSSETSVHVPSRRRLSAAAIKRIARAQKRRWARIREERKETRVKTGQLSPMESFWAKMSPKERAAEIARRRRVAIANKKKAAA